MAENNKDYEILPHHQQQALCETRLPYRQGRKLTAVKVYSINNESRHLLVFGVPALNLRQETKSLFLKFGKLQLNITKYPSEQFTETYHAIYEDIQSARVAKKMLDTKNFYGGSLHVCYAPELESIADTRQKLLLRNNSVAYRLRNLQKAKLNNKKTPNNEIKNIVDIPVQENIEQNKLYMGDANKIEIGKKRKVTDYKSVKHCKLKKSRNFDSKSCVVRVEKEKSKKVDPKGTKETSSNIISEENIEVVDFTSTDKEVLTNINEELNYNKFGNEVIKQIPYKPVNKIRFNLNKNTIN